MHGGKGGRPGAAGRRPSIWTMRLAWFFILCAAVGFVCMGLFVVYPQIEVHQMRAVRERLCVARPGPENPAAQTQGMPPVTDPKLAFVFGAVGPYSRKLSKKCLAAVESLSLIGGWQGDVYLMTDDEQCFDEESIRRDAKNENVHLVRVDMDDDRDRLQTAEEGHRRLRFPTGSTRYQSNMAVKTKILEVLNPEVEIALWYDCDVLAVRPGCIHDVVAEKPRITADKPFLLSRDRHVGSFAVHATHSKDALLEWRKGIYESNAGEGAGVPDFRVFMDLFADRYGILPPVYHDYFPQAACTVDEVERGEEHVCFKHLSGGRCGALGANGVHELVSSLDLPSYGSSSVWCSSMAAWLKRSGITTQSCDADDLLQWPFR